MKTPTKRIPLLVLGSWLALSGPEAICAQLPYDGSPYTAWASDYTGNESNTVGLWKFDQPDPSKDSYDGAANPNSYPTAAMNVAGVITNVTGKFGQGISINSAATDSRATVNTGFNGSALSVEVWYQTPDVVDTAGWLFHRLGRATNLGGLGLQVTSTQLVLHLGNGSSVSTVSVAAPELSANTWYNFAVTFENVNGNGVASIFLNGDRLGGETLSGFGNLALPDRDWAVGNRNVSTYNPMLGTYDNFRIADVAYQYAAIPEPHTTASLLILAPLFCLARRFFFRCVERA